MSTEGGADLRTADNDPVLRMRMYIQFKLLDQLRIRPEPDLTDVHPKWMNETTDAVLGAIAEAGMVIVERKAAAILLGATADQYDMMDACLYANDLYRLQREAESGQLQTLLHRDWAKDQYDLDRGAGRG